MEPLKGYDAAFALRGWRDAGKPDAPREVAGHDPATLRAKVDAFMADGRHGYVELAAWSFELNDWVRMEAFEAPKASLADALARDTGVDFRQPSLTDMEFGAADFD